MDSLIAKSTLKIERTSLVFKRYLLKTIDLGNRFIGVKGARGSGKTTLLLQLAKQFGAAEQVLYVSLDDFYFFENSLYGLAEKFWKRGGKLLLLDEVHKYPGWSRELKLMYDDFNDLQVVFTSSSILDIYRGESDLSRRVVHYFLKEMSYREFLALRKGIIIPAYSLSDLFTRHSAIALDILGKIKPFQYFDEYLKYGAYPYYDGDAFSYYQKLGQTINLILETDLPAIENIDYQNIVKIKRLLHILAVNVPFTPNILKLSGMIELNRNALVRTLQWLQKASLIQTLYAQSRSVSSLNKPDKIWLNNTNLMHLMGRENVNTGTIRETFVLQNLANSAEISLPEQGDLLINQQYTLEIGGPGKNHTQIKDLANAFVVKDDIELGHATTIPMWQFGFLY
jgi:predicted AAA+ superfamily ATPase